MGVKYAKIAQPAARSHVHSDVLVPQLPQALAWSHNAYYHRWLVDSMPTRVRCALDVGCGSGDLASLLATKADRVVGVDRSVKMIELARQRHPGVATWLLGDVLTDDLPLDPRGYDLVTCVACLHHLPLRPGLRTLAGLVRPGGLLVVVGLHPPVSAADLAVDAASVPANWIMGARLRRQGRGGERGHEYGMPIVEPAYPFTEIRAAAADLTPGAVLRRRLYFRHSLMWRRPLRAA